MFTITGILTVILVVIVLVILWKIAELLAGKLGIDQIWMRILWLVVVLVIIIWAFGAFGIMQPIIR